MASITWTAATGGNWSTATDWSSSTVPVRGDDVFINQSLSGTYIVTLDVSQPTGATQNEGYKSLTIGASNAVLALSAPSTTLTVISSNNAATTTLSAGTINISNTSNLVTDIFDQTGGVFLESGGQLSVVDNKATGSDFLVSGGTFTLSGGAVDVTHDAEFTGGTNTISGGSFAANTLTVGFPTVVTLGGGADFISTTTITNNGFLTGSGTVEGTMTGAGVVTADAGTLELANQIAAATPLSFVITNNAASSLQLDEGTGAGNTFSFQGAAGDLALGGTIAFNGTVKGLNISQGATPTNFVDILNTPGVTVSTGGTGTGTTGTVTLSNNDVLNLTGITGTAPWRVETTPDAANTGTDVFLVCYAAGTRILTATGERAIESLLQGDIVLTLSDGELKAQPVKWLGGRRIDLTAHPRPETVAPVRVQRGAFDDNMPHTDLLVSPDHAILVDGKLICARQLINGTTIRQEKGWTSVDYFHVELDAHAILVAEGLPAESYLDTGNRGFFANSGAPVVLHPDLTNETDYPTRQAGSCAQFVWDEASVRPIWQRLADRAGVIGQPVSQHATTTDADLQLRAKSRTVKPIYSDDRLAIFVLPRSAQEARLLSRAQSPTDARPWLEDRRRLGVRVQRVVLRGANELREIPMDHPDLTKGWWDIERDGRMMSRWTDGDAVVPLPKMDGNVMLEVHLAGEMIYTVEAEPEGQAESRAA
jgi:hypothetical protein